MTPAIEPGGSAYVVLLLSRVAVLKRGASRRHFSVVISSLKEIDALIRDAIDQAMFLGDPA